MQVYSNGTQFPDPPPPFNQQPVAYKCFPQQMPHLGDVIFQMGTQNQLGSAAATPPADGLGEYEISLYVQFSFESYSSGYGLTYRATFKYSKVFKRPTLPSLIRNCLEPIVLTLKDKAYAGLPLVTAAQQASDYGIPLTVTATPS
jgi:hypothetical protein